MPKLILQLGDSDFQQRETASQSLIRVGGPVIPKLETSLQVSTGEAAFRMLYVIRILATSEDAQVAASAFECLQRIAVGKHELLASRAAVTLAQAIDTRELIALERLEKLGASVERVGEIENDRLRYVPRLMKFGREWTGTTADLRFLKWQRHLRSLELEGASFDDQAIELLSELPLLDVLTLRKCNITNKAIASLATIPGLTSISIQYCPIDDECIDDLRAMPTVIQYNLFGTALTRDVAMTLETPEDEIEDQAGEAPPAIAKPPANPPRIVRVDYRKGALLGVACRSTGIASERCIIYRVEPDSAADKCGLQVGDQIVEFDERKVQNFQELTSLVAEFGADSKVSIKWLRSGQELTTTATLGSW